MDMLIFDTIEEFNTANDLIHRTFKQNKAGYVAKTWQSEPRINGAEFGLILPQKGDLKNVFGQLIKDSFAGKFRVIPKNDAGWFPPQE